MLPRKLWVPDPVLDGGKGLRLLNRCGHELPRRKKSCVTLKVPGWKKKRTWRVPRYALSVVGPFYGKQSSVLSSCQNQNIQDCV